MPSPPSRNPTPATRSRRGTLLAALLAAAAATLPYLETPAWDFIDLDDRQVLVQPFALWAEPTLSALGADLTRTAHGQWFPVGVLTVFLDRVVWGPTAYGVRLQNLAWLAATAACVVLLGRRLGLGPRAAAIAGLAFALHPAHVEVGAWAASCRVYALSTTWTLLGLVVYLGPLAPGAPLGWRRGAAVTACLALALLSKSNVGVALVPWLALAAWSRGRLRADAAWLVLQAALGLAVVALTVRQDVFGRLRAGEALPLLERVGPVLASLGHSTRHVLLPHPLTPTYGAAHGPGPLDLLTLAGLLAGVGWLAARGARRELVLVGMFLAALAPTSGLLPLNVFVADRYLFLATAPAALLAGAGLQALLARAGPSRRRVIVLLVAGVLGLAAGWSARYARDWRTHVALRRRALEVHDDPETRQLLAAALVGPSAPAEGEAEAWRLARGVVEAGVGDVALAHRVLGVIALRRGALGDARVHLAAVASSTWSWRHEEARRLVVVLLDLDDLDAAAAAVERLDLDAAPGARTEGLVLRGHVELARGDPTGAAASFQAALAAAPAGDPVVGLAWYGLARAERAAGRPAEASAAAGRVTDPAAARALRAHLALDAGDLERAAGLLAGPPPDDVEERLARLRLDRRRGEPVARLRADLAALLGRAAPGAARRAASEPDLRDLLPVP